MPIKLGRRTLRETFFRVDPYDEFDYQRYLFDPALNDVLQGGDPVFRWMIEEVKPRLVIEIGSWKGGSAITMGRAAKEAGLDTEILCIDTFSGTAEMWLDKGSPEYYGSLRLVNGIPQLGYQFMANVCHAGLQKRITPLPLPSNQAHDLLKRLPFPPQADLIYIDGSHLYADVKQDVLNFHGLLTQRGVLFGHDWDMASVHDGACHAADALGKQATQLDGKFWRLT